MEGKEDAECASLSESICESDGSLHLPLSSRRTNYRLTDSGLIARATEALNELDCCVTPDREGHGSRGKLRLWSCRQETKQG